jgi:hypothetical protein
LAQTGRAGLACGFVAALAAHYALGHARTRWLLQRG